MEFKLRPTLNADAVANHFSAALDLVSAAMRLIKADSDEKTCLSVEDAQVWEVLNAADFRLCKLREALFDEGDEAAS